MILARMIKWLDRWFPMVQFTPVMFSIWRLESWPGKIGVSLGLMVFDSKRSWWKRRSGFVLIEFAQGKFYFDLFWLAYSLANARSRKVMRAKYPDAQAQKA